MTCSILGFDCVMRSVTYCTIFCAVASISFSGLATVFAAMPAGNGENQYSCVVHVHSMISDEGRNSLAALTSIATNYGIDAIFLTDNLTYTLTYGMTPLRNILRASYMMGSVMEFGPEKYLREVDRENRRQNEVLYVPGVEVCPRFYWVGSFFSTNLVCHDHQRNLMALGVMDASVIRGIPEACGFVWGKNPVWIVVTRAVFVLFVLACVAFFTMRSLLAYRSNYPERVIRRSLLVGVILPLGVLMLVVNGLASLVPAFQIYGEDAGLSHEKRSLEYLKKNDIVSYWAHPEAFDDQDFSRFRFKIRTDPYPGILAMTRGYTGFGGVYSDVNTLIEPGMEWDNVLNQFLSGLREAPAWCFGEMLYHYEGQAGKKLNDVETVIWAREKTAEALLKSMRAGRFYARENFNGQSLVLDRWQITGSSDGKRTVTALVSSRNAGVKVTLTLIRNGLVVKELKDATTPVELSVPVDEQAPSSKFYYRLLVSGPRPLRLAANPIFTSSAYR